MTLAKTYLLFTVFVVVLYIITSWWVAATAASSARADAFLHSFLALLVAGTRRILLLESAFITHLVVPYLVCKATPLLEFFCKATPCVKRRPCLCVLFHSHGCVTPHLTYADRRQPHLSRRRSLHGCTASYVTCEQYTHKYSTYRVAQHDHISSREHAWLKSWKADDCASLCP